MSTQTVTITRLGTQGHGIAEDPQGSIYVPYTLPGETVAIARNGNHGTLISLAMRSDERVEPLCRHFDPDGDACGGCSLQHFGDAPYQAFKRDLVAGALRSKGLSPEVSPLVACTTGQRRRAVFSGRRTENGLLMGFNRAETNHIVSIEECPITTASIMTHLGSIRKIANELATGSQSFRLTVTATMTGLDIAADGLKTLSDKQRRKTIETVLGLKGIARVTANGEILVEPQKPLVDFGGVLVAPPPGAFLQATQQAEEVMAALVLSHVGKAKRVADLFAGCGTFALRLARNFQVHAVENEDKSLRALDQAARGTQGLKPVKVERRDLFRRPLMPQELKSFDAVVFDPPRAGAEAQVREIVRSTVKKVVAVSCNPVTLSRDLRILVDGGFAIRSVTPVDQFLWSSHVEAVALLER